MFAMERTTPGVAMSTNQQKEINYVHDDDDFSSDSTPWWRDFHLWLNNVVEDAEGRIMSQFTILAIFGFHLRLHFFFRGDGEFFHSHTRSFISLCLLGGYRERFCPARKERIVKPGTITVRKASDLHNVEPFCFPCVTLAITTPNIRRWEKLRRS